MICTAYFERLAHITPHSSAGSARGGLHKHCPIDALSDLPPVRRFQLVAHCAKAEVRPREEHRRWNGRVTVGQRKPKPAPRQQVATGRRS